MAVGTNVKTTFPPFVTTRRTTTDPTEVLAALEQWASATSQPAFPAGPPAAEYEEWLERAQIPVADEHARRRATAILLRPLERAEFDKYMNKRAGMAAGLDGCSWEILQHLSEPAKDRVFLTLRNLLLHGYDSSEREWRIGKWIKRAWTSPIPKSKYDGTTERLRGISVTPAVARLLGKIVTARLTSYVESMGCLCDDQSGFRRDRSATDPVSQLQNWITELAGNRGDTGAHILSLDIKRAFDMCEPRLATKYLSRIGVPDALCDLLIAQLDGSTTQVMSAFGMSQEIPPKPILKGASWRRTRMTSSLATKTPAAHHTTPTPLLRLLRGYYGIIGCEVSLSKSWWLPKFLWAMRELGLLLQQPSQDRYVSDAERAGAGGIPVAFWGQAHSYLLGNAERERPSGLRYADIRLRSVPFYQSRLQPMDGARSAAHALPPTWASFRQKAQPVLDEYTPALLSNLDEWDVWTDQTGFVKFSRHRVGPKTAIRPTIPAAPASAEKRQREASVSDEGDLPLLERAAPAPPVRGAKRRRAAPPSDDGDLPLLELAVRMRRDAAEQEHPWPRAGTNPPTPAATGRQPAVPDPKPRKKRKGSHLYPHLGGFTGSPDEGGLLQGRRLIFESAAMEQVMS
eukprot:gene853-15523_t